MSDELLIGLAAVLVLGIIAQWLSWRMRLPAILLLLVFGFAAGPLCELLLDRSLIDPDRLFGDALFGLVSASVAIILFEGGLSLKLRELGPIAHAVRNLISVGIAVTWLVCTVAARYVLGLDWPLALLLGAILTVTGPTVVIPLLRQVRAGAQLGALLKWEGILNDPIGAVIAVLVFESILAHQGGDAHASAVLFGMGLTAVGGVLIGAVGAALLILPLRYYWIPDYLQSPATLMLVLLVFVASNQMQAESGLLAVTVMGVVLANQKWVGVRHIVEFKENLRVLLISVLFILLAAQLELDQVNQIKDVRSFVFLAIVLFVARPLSVWLSMIGSGFNSRQRLFLSLVAPRGIVAAAVTSLFAFELTSANIAGAERLVPTVFLVIVGSITFCGITARPLTRWLRLSPADPQGVLLIGAHDWARAIGKTLQDNGVSVLLVDTNATNARSARMAGLPVRKGSIFNDELVDDLDLTGIRRLIALTPNDEANALAAVHLIDQFGRKEVYQLSPFGQVDMAEGESQSLRGRYAFGGNANFIELAHRFAEGASVKATGLTAEFDFDSFTQRHGDRALPLFVLSESGKLSVWTADNPPRPVAGQKIISLVNAE